MGDTIYDFFSANTDRISLLEPPPGAPLCSTINMLGSGLLGLMGLRRKWWGQDNVALDLIKN